jgi:predicted  nucleic acid-binding Zn-ribbon protein
MTALNQAKDRLEHSVARLQAALDSMLARDRAAASEQAAAKQSAEAAVTALRGVTDTVERRLDAAIDHLTRILE